MDGVPEFHTKSILICPYHFAFSFHTAILLARWHGHRDDISFRQKQIGFNKCTLVAQVFDVTLVDAVPSRKKRRFGAKFTRIFSFIFHLLEDRFRKKRFKLRASPCIFIRW